MADLRDIPDSPPELPEPLLLVSATGSILLIGPLFLPGKGICPPCAGHAARTAGWQRPVPEPPCAEALQVLAVITSQLADRWKQGDPLTDHLRAVFEVDTATGSRETHPLVPRADCPRCAGISRTDRPLTDHCGTRLGIVSEIKITGAPFLGSYSAVGEYCAPFPVPGKRPMLLRQHSFGKGPTRTQALEGCIGEAVERYSTIYTGREALTSARLADLPGAIDPRQILLVSDRQYAARDEWNAARAERYHVPEEFDPNEEIEWLEGTDLTTGRGAFVPAACCLMWYGFAAGRRRFAHADSIGCGAGRTLEEAALSGLLEWVERDAVSLWWYSRARRPEVPLAKFHSPYLEMMASELERNRRTLHILDLTTDFKLPVYAAISPNRDGEEPLFASACAFSPRQAAEKAAAEVIQMLFCRAQLGEMDSEIQTWLDVATLHTEEYLNHEGTTAPPPEPDRAPAPVLLAKAVQSLAGEGIRSVLVDQSSPDTLLRTARIIAPGLRHVWARFAPGRLYDVPVRLGWLPGPLKEGTLNSIFCMI